MEINISMCKNMYYINTLNYPNKRPGLGVRKLDERHHVRQRPDGARVDVFGVFPRILRRLDPVLVGHHFFVARGIQE